ncbi:pyrimidine dimer DNA glycosylase/endonuclease V [Alistipes sp.]|uniref:pyrimidine dimer DNA glycosylase/endonuclease V n=1 Tax=Alistipes sp. TaxID=1872444 RepID=UPI003AF12796
MRLWSLHPRYLDAPGLVACWREALLARAVLAGRTVGYRRHPQLERFSACADPVAAVDAYLTELLREADRRGYRFDRSKVGEPCGVRIGVTRGQLDYEFGMLMDKFKTRCPERYEALAGTEGVEPHPLFTVRAGAVEKWERKR